MEHLLNILWLLVMVALILGAIAAGRSKQLRCSLPVAIVCLAMLALVLFPALSMTDDIQMARVDVETSIRHLADSFLFGASHGVMLQVFAVSVVLLSLIHSGFHSPAGRLVRVAIAEPHGRLSSTRPQAVRPPPVLCF